MKYRSGGVIASVTPSLAVPVLSGGLAHVAGLAQCLEVVPVEPLRIVDAIEWNNVVDVLCLLDTTMPLAFLAERMSFAVGVAKPKPRLIVTSLLPRSPLSIALPSVPFRLVPTCDTDLAIPQAEALRAWPQWFIGHLMDSYVRRKCDCSHIRSTPIRRACRL